MSYDPNKSRFENSLDLAIDIIKIIPLIVGLYFLWTCSSSEHKQGAKPLAISIPSNLNENEKALAVKAIPKMLDNLPGLNKYGEDLNFVGISYNPKDEKGITITFKVPEDSKIPYGYRSQGHTCRLYVNRDASTIIVQKTECAAVCLDRDIDGTELDPHGADMIIPLR